VDPLLPFDCNEELKRKLMQYRTREDLTVKEGHKTCDVFRKFSSSSVSSLFRNQAEASSSSSSSAVE